MAAIVHIPLEEIEVALERARAGDSVVLDGKNESFYLRRAKQKGSTGQFVDPGVFHIVRTDLRPLGEILADPAKEWSDIVMDDQWGSDMDEILRENRAHDRDPWVE